MRPSSRSASPPRRATLGPIIPPSLPFVIYAMMANVSVGALFLAGLLPGILMAVMMMITVAYFAHKNGWGGDVKFSATRFGRAMIELGVVAAAPVLTYYATVQAATAAAAGTAGGHGRHRAAVPGRLEVQVPGRAAHHDAGAADRRHDHRAVHAHRGRHRGQRLGVVPGHCLVPHDELEAVRQDQPGLGGDHRHRDVHRRRGVDLRLDAHRHRRHRRHRASGCWPSPGTRGCSC
jgi:hypothetical protein